MNLQAKADKIGLYCHVPFCASTCDFCAFYQEKPRRQDIQRYLNCIEQELLKSGITRDIDTIFWGGGTPGLLAAKDLERLGKAVQAVCRGPVEEWTVEMAPSVVKLDKLKVLKDLGVTRISMGVQSFNPKLLKSLGRLHAPNQIFQALERIQQVGFDAVNLDLIFSIPGQTWELLEEDLKQATILGVDHLSTYCLTFEEDTALYVKLSEGKITRDEDQEVDLYKKTWAYLEKAGYAQYEVSNFAHPGKECLHNVNTWKMHEWLGVGPSASSQIDGFRFTNASDLSAWQEGVEQGKPAYQERVPLDDTILATDTLIFGLRMNQGVCLNRLKERYPKMNWACFNAFWEDLEAEGLLTRQSGLITLTQEGRLLADWIGTQLLDLSA